MYEPITWSFYLAGTLAANHTMNILVPWDIQIVHVSLSGTNVNNAQLSLGINGTTALYMALKDFGDSSVPLEYERAAFVGAQYPRLADGTNLLLTLDFDGAAGTAIANATVVITALRG